MIQKKKTFIKILSFLLLLGCSLGVEKHWNLAEEYLRREQYLRAIEEYTRIVNYGYKNNFAVRAQKEIAMIYEKHLKDYPTAIRAYRDLFQRAKDKSTKKLALLAIANIYSEKIMNFHIAAEEYARIYKEFSENEKDGPEIMLLWSKALVESGQHGEAAEQYKEFRKRYPGHAEGPKALLEEGKARHAKGDIEEGKNIFNEIIKTYKSQEAYQALVSEAYYGMGESFEAQDDLKAALDAYQESLKSYPNRAVVEVKIDRLLKRKKERKI